MTIGRKGEFGRRIDLNSSHFTPQVQRGELGRGGGFISASLRPARPPLSHHRLMSTYLPLASDTATGRGFVAI